VLVYLTVDTELSPGLFRTFGSAGRRQIHESSIDGATPSGPVGVGYQMDVLDRHGLKGVFFVDPMPGLVWGIEAVTDIVGPIVARGHDVQLHIHTEWLQHAPKAPVSGRHQHIKDFTFSEQVELIGLASDFLVKAGAPKPIAFRAGNYGASDDTLVALAQNGLRYDTSFSPGFAGSPCRIGLPPNTSDPVEHRGIVEVPIGSIKARRGGFRHAQITALSDWELTDAIRHAASVGRKTFTIVSHSFELLSRDRSKANRIVMRRFERFCDAVSKMQDTATGTYLSNPPVPEGNPTGEVLPAKLVRSVLRVGEQAIGNWLYGAK
jgi:peptidoglycan/xylan/chitin deacetylase (PgdA/CDA1 family)